MEIQFVRALRALGGVLALPAREELIGAAGLPPSPSILVVDEESGLPDCPSLARRDARPSFHRAPAGGIPLPFPDGSFDLVLFELVLFRHADPAAFLAEARRVLRPGGAAVAASEPDFGGVLEHPPACAIMGLVAGKLYRAGADPMIGRRLPSLFAAPAWELLRVVVHPLPPARSAPPGPERAREETALLRAVVEGMLPPAIMQRWQEAFTASGERGELFLHVPHVGVAARRR